MEYNKISQWKSRSNLIHAGLRLISCGKLIHNALKYTSFISNPEKINFKQPNLFWTCDWSHYKYASVELEYSQHKNNKWQTKNLTKTWNPILPEVLDSCVSLFSSYLKRCHNRGSRKLRLKVRDFFLIFPYIPEEVLFKKSLFISSCLDWVAILDV